MKSVPFSFSLMKIFVSSLESQVWIDSLCALLLRRIAYGFSRKNIQISLNGVRTLTLYSIKRFNFWSFERKASFQTVVQRKYSESLKGKKIIRIFFLFSKTISVSWRRKWKMKDTAKKHFSIMTSSKSKKTVVRCLIEFDFLYGVPECELLILYSYFLEKIYVNHVQRLSGKFAGSERKWDCDPS